MTYSRAAAVAAIWLAVALICIYGPRPIFIVSPLLFLLAVMATGIVVNGRRP